MRKKWNNRTSGEKIAVIINAVLFVGMLISTVLRFTHDWYHGTDLCWFLFTLHYFVNAIFLWKANHDEAIKSLVLGCMLGLMYLPVWLGILFLF